MRPLGLQEILSLGLVLMGAALMYLLMPISTRDGCWTHNILRNWEQVGLIKSGGRLVQNPGGFDVLEHPEIYTGHRPFFLYPSFWVGHLFGGAGEHGLPFYLVLTLGAAISIWALLGRTAFALTTAGVVTLCPGHIRNAIIVDPVAVPVTLGFPAMLCVLQLLRAAKISLGWGLMLGGVAVTFAALNWTTAFPIAIAFVTVTVSMRSYWRRWLPIFSIMGACVVYITFVSVSNKVSSGDPAPLSSRLLTLHNAYLFGPGGYGGYPMNWPKAIVRLVCANLIGLLPLWAIYSWKICHCLRSRVAISWRVFLPLIAAVVMIAGMRNSFAHHPWMAASVLIYGTVFSMALLDGVKPSSDRPKLLSEPVRESFLPQIVFLTGCLIYGCVVVWALRVNSADVDALVTLVRQNTSRADAILVSSTDDPWLAQIGEQRLSAVLDRKIWISQEKIKAAIRRSGAAKGGFFLTATNKDAKGTLVAHTIWPDSPAQKMVVGLLNWYRRAIARREKGDRLEAEAIYYLYQLP